MLKYFKINIFILSIFSLSMISGASITLAQTPQQIVDSIQNNIQISLSPEFPKAGDTVSIHLDSYSTPLEQANISYIVNGKVVSKGYGLTDFTTTAGKIGSNSKVLVRIITTNGSVVERTITIQPADIDLVWQASSSVPPFYQGKALYPHQGLITFTAIPNISTNSNVAKSINSYIYTWKKDGDVLGDFSGYGKSTFTLRGTIISRTFTMEVDVSTINGVSVGSASATIKPQSPGILFYENNPLLGVLYNHSLSNITMLGKELSILSVPYFFNNGGEPVNLQYKWTMNGKGTSSQQDPSIITLRNDSGVEGSANVGLQINNTLKALQSASRSVIINFNQNNQNSL